MRTPLGAPEADATRGPLSKLRAVPISAVAPELWPDRVRNRPVSRHELASRRQEVFRSRNRCAAGGTAASAAHPRGPSLCRLRRIGGARGWGVTGGRRAEQPPARRIPGGPAFVVFAGSEGERIAALGGGLKTTSPHATHPSCVRR